MLPIFTQIKPKTWKRTKRRANYEAKKALGKLKLYKHLPEEERKEFSKYMSDYRLRKLREKDEKYMKTHRDFMRGYMQGYNQRKRGEVKQCSKCNRTLPYCKFDLREPKRPDTKHQWYSHYQRPPKQTLRPYCKECRSKYNKEYYARRKQHGCQPA